MSKFTELWKQKNTVEKPGDSTHTAKWDRCVEHVKAGGSGVNAYAVCTAMMGDESFKASESEEEFKHSVDTYLTSYVKRLNISAGLPSKVVDASGADKSVDTSFAGGTPNSLLAGQDLERTTKTITVKKKGTGEELTMEVHNGSEETAKAVFEGTELSAIAIFEDYMGFNIFVTPEMADADGKPIGCYVVIGQDGSLQVFFSLKDARNFVDSVLVTNKGQVENTGYELEHLAHEAKSADAEEASDIVGNIKRVQEKRQKATISARAKEKSMVGKSFKGQWETMSKSNYAVAAMYDVKVMGAQGTMVFQRYGLTLEAAKEVLATVKESYKGHVIEICNDMGFREVYAPE